MQNINAVRAARTANDEVSREVLANAIYEMLSNEHTLSIVDMLFKLNNKMYDEKLRRRIQNILQKDDRFTLLGEKLSVEGKRAAYVYILTEHAVRFNRVEFTPTKRVMTGKRMTGARDLAANAFTLMVVEMKNQGYSLADSYELLVGTRTSVVVDQVMKTLTHYMVLNTQVRLLIVKATYAKQSLNAVCVKMFTHI